MKVVGWKPQVTKSTSITGVAETSEARPRHLTLETILHGVSCGKADIVLPLLDLSAPMDIVLNDLLPLVDHRAPFKLAHESGEKYLL